MEEYLIATRSMNEELYSLCVSLVPDYVKKVGIQNVEADKYFYDLMRLDAEWVINLDEDAFILDFDRVTGLLQYMKENDIDCCGMPDGGVIADRFHNPIAMNAFFNIIHVGKLKKKFSGKKLKKAHFDFHLIENAPLHMMRTGRYEFDEFEPYYTFFFWLVKSGFKMLYLDAVQWARDPISTMLLDHENEPLLIHTWYARAFNEQRARFMHAYNYCRNHQQKTMPQGILWNL